MEKRKINYVKRWAGSGTCYSQGVNITLREYNKILNKLYDEQAKKDLTNDNNYRLFIKQPLERDSNIVFTNLTQRDFFNKFLKAKLLDRNTCFIINEGGNKNGQL